MRAIDGISQKMQKSRKIRDPVKMHQPKRDLDSLICLLGLAGFIKP